jgi:hypothetical protein
VFRQFRSLLFHQDKFYVFSFHGLAKPYFFDYPSTLQNYRSFVKASRLNFCVPVGPVLRSTGIFSVLSNLNPFSGFSSSTGKIQKPLSDVSVFRILHVLGSAGTTDNWYSIFVHRKLRIPRLPARSTKYPISGLELV